MILRKCMTWIIAAFWIAVLVSGLSGISIIYAQDSNLLNDPSFETTETYKRVTIDSDGTYYDVPPAWNGWAMQHVEGDPVWKNRIPTGFPHTALFKIDGARSFSISRGGASFTAAVFQTVTVPDKAKVKGSARGFMERGTQGQATPGGQFKVGIDPNGGSNPLDPAIVWSTTATNDDAWVQLSVEATATGTRVTLFLFATQTEPSDPDAMYWDDAVLKVGGDGGTTNGGTPVPAVPTPPPFANFVVPQPPQADGSYIHTVQEGDTLAAIAVAYQTTPDDILKLNNMTSGRFLQIGQKLIIKMAPPGGSSSDAIADAQGTAQVEPGSTDEAVATGEVVVTEEAAATEEALSTEEVAVTEEAAPAETAQVAPPTVDVVISTVTDLPPAPVTQVAALNNNASIPAVCLTLFEDANQNRIREEGEALLANGTITVSSAGQTVKDYTTDGASEPLCLTDLTAGIYTVAAQPPDGYGMTTSPQLSVRLQVGSSVDVNFGAAKGIQASVPPAADSGNEQPQAIVDETASTTETSALIQNIGLIVFGMAGFVLVFGLGAALLLRRR